MFPAGTMTDTPRFQVFGWGEKEIRVAGIEDKGGSGKGNEHQCFKEDKEGTAKQEPLVYFSKNKSTVTMKQSKSFPFDPDTPDNILWERCKNVTILQMR